MSSSIVRAINARLFAPGLFDRAALVEAEEQVARQMLKHQWQLDDDQLDKRLQQIKSANNWHDVTVQIIWQFYVLSGMKFSDDGQLQLEMYPWQGRLKNISITTRSAAKLL